jgi:hypothetical protein
MSVVGSVDAVVVAARAVDVVKREARARAAVPKAARCRKVRREERGAE